MDIRFLTTFIEVAKTRHFGKAAENLYLTQSAVSARIKLLEEYFHTTLFIRQRNSIQLTQSGEKLLPYARQLCSTLNEAKQELQIQSSEYVVCGATQLASELMLPTTLSHLHNTFPDWSVKAEVLSLDGLSRQLHERVTDLAFSTEPLKSEEVKSEVLLENQLGLYRIGEGSDVVDAAEFVAIDWGSKARDLLLTLYPQLRDAKLRTNSLNLALNNLQYEGGVAVLPEGTVNQLDPTIAISLIQPLEGITMKVYLHTMKQVRRVGLEALITSVSAIHPV
ncbi:LysR family transcriptional regulator [Alteromonas stellipolaris]|uniref:LysR family transcriptional regulator n=1 Tax=Alteromonas stellipolaris TaxID=233316 RepID=A0AAW7YY70_9ALTE|nr:MULTISPECIES: LysR family transcriptional regulator [Alteromonas]AMJ90999.1 LysR family transcriptional regulator [Alteromonas sp. Mac2]AMJ87137.1 LysR family transcriptional regulator [Alteromonas sp. Mac1]AMJ96573.1 LysR family transcriptional regulator [Alteromonas stellipolaris]ANB22136.1 LysR family transcriptional regulator [Alteromonas stellipolaris]ANB23991.1 LysR family transcriptional regulator [Alteromonas stellipolaris]